VANRVKVAAAAAAIGFAAIQLVPLSVDTPPVSQWVVRHHVEEGREHLNLSQLDRPQRDADEAGEAIREGEMPPAYYTLTHPEARLTDAEKEALAAGLDATLRDVPKKERGGHD
jgi:hypothetical protein